MIGDKAYDSDPLDASLRGRGIEMVASHKKNRPKQVTHEENIVEIGRRLNVKVDKTQIEKTLALNYEFTKNSLVPEPEVLEGLAQLKRSSLLLGLITNCNPTVPMLFHNRH